ncbi:hypothetical protein GGQ85_003041 [Nitrobacter vulgaris]|nr:hypothetical protein [Nitrobacter vulgaris]
MSVSCQAKHSRSSPQLVARVLKLGETVSSARGDSLIGRQAEKLQMITSASLQLSFGWASTPAPISIIINSISIF